MQRAPTYLLSLLGCLLGSALALGAETPSDYRPDPAAVQRYGLAYRYPQAGWIHLHIEGEPYERGYQHGRLLAPEIAAHLRCFATVNSPKAPGEGWKLIRLLADSLFLRRYEKEFLEEMKGIAEGATAAGARFEGRPLDLVDIVAINSWAEIETLESALEATPNGLEGLRFPKPDLKAMPKPKAEHCSAFAATGPATADGKIVFGHITMFSLYPSNFYNVWLDLKPAKGHRVMMQTFPGGIQSGMDYYMNDAGLLVCETTIHQTRFDIKGMTVASRIRKALQYADSIDKAVDILKMENNGLYTNEWLLADIKTNEIAMFELGTHKSKLWRSSKNEWFAGTEGFYFGCNNVKDMDVRLESVPSVEGRPTNLVFRPSVRDQKWIELYQQHKGKIDANFGKLAFTTPPVAAYHSLDAKFTTTALAKELKTWAIFGPPLGRTWQPTEQERKDYPEVRLLVSNPWTILHTKPPEKQEAKAPKVVDLIAPLEASEAKAGDAEKKLPIIAAAWHGTILPKTNADIWLAVAFSEYEKIMALENALRERGGGKLTTGDRDRLAVEMFQHRSNYLRGVKALGQVPLSKIQPDPARDEWYRLASGKGVLVLHELRKLMSDEVFQKAMDSFGRQHAGKEVGTAQFQEHIEKAGNKTAAKYLDHYWTQPGFPEPRKEKRAGVGEFSVLSFLADLEKCLIICGTLDEQAANREAAEALQRAIIQRGSNITVPIKPDREVSDDEMRNRHLLLIGRPECNLLTERFRHDAPITFGSRSFVIRGETYAHPGSAVVVADANPRNRRYSIVAIAGLEGASTWRAVSQLLERGQTLGDVLVLPNGGSPKTMVLPGRDLTRELIK